MSHEVKQCPQCGAPSNAEKCEYCGVDFYIEKKQVETPSQEITKTKGDASDFFDDPDRVDKVLSIVDSALKLGTGASSSSVKRTATKTARNVQTNTSRTTNKSFLTFTLLTIFGSIIGLQYFYLGKYIQGIFRIGLFLAIVFKPVIIFLIMLLIMIDYVRLCTGYFRKHTS